MIWPQVLSFIVATFSSKAEEADWHIAGTPCVDHSPRGSGQGLQGKSGRPFFCWACQRRRIQEKYIFQENVPQFDESWLDLLLGDLYHIQWQILDPFTLGWPVARKRKYCLLRHKYKTGPFAMPLNEFSRRFLKQNQFLLGTLSDRKDLPPWDCFFVARADELLAELKWAAGRPCSQWKLGHESRETPGDSELDPSDSSPHGVFWQTLTDTEQKFLEGYLSQERGMVVQLNQNPEITGVSSTFEKLATIVKNAGLLW